MFYPFQKDCGIGRWGLFLVTAAYRFVGMRITADRIALLQENKAWKDFVTVNDLVLPGGTAGGTEVILRIPVQTDDTKPD